MVAVVGPLGEQKVATLAKIQVLHREGLNFSGRITWQAEGAELTAGAHVVPLPGEAAPDAPPMLDAVEPEARTAGAQETITISLPIIDREKKPMTFQWWLVDPNDETDNPGHLFARTTGAPSVQWTAPAIPHPYEVHVQARDEIGQVARWKTTVAVGELTEHWRNRKLLPMARFGSGGDRVWRWLTRLSDGSYLTIDDKGVVTSVDTAWRNQRVFTFSGKEEVRQPVAMEASDAGYVVLESRRALRVDGTGSVLGAFGTFSDATDLAIAADGTVYIADTRSGGVLVYEADGRYRARLGLVERGAWEDCGRLAIGPDQEIYVLDRTRGVVTKFSNEHRVLNSWTLEFDPNSRKQAVDIAWHPQGPVVLLNNGELICFDKQAKIRSTITPVTDAYLISGRNSPDSIHIDAMGTMIVSSPDDGVLVKYDAKGRVMGVRGPRLWELDKFVADGKQRIFGMNYQSCMISMFDNEGWLRRRFGGERTKSSGPFDQPVDFSVSANGEWLVVADARRFGAVLYNLNRLQDRPLVFGQNGENAGQFQSLSAVTIDDDGRSYVVDDRLRRISVFDRSGGFRFHFGTYERGKNIEEMAAPTLLAADPGGSVVYVSIAATVRFSAGVQIMVFPPPVSLVTTVYLAVKFLANLRSRLA